MVESHYGITVVSEEPNCPHPSPPPSLHWLCGAEFLYRKQTARVTGARADEKAPLAGSRRWAARGVKARAVLIAFIGHLI